MPIFILIALYILADLIALLLLGHLIGVLATLLLVLATGFIGIQLIKREGMQALRHVQLSMMQGRVNKTELFRGSTSVISGFLLLMPGPISDLLGIICAIPALWSRASGQKDTVEPYYPDMDRNAQTYEGQAEQRADNEQASGNTIEGEYLEHDKPSDRN